MKEAPPGFEPGMADLQSAALPLGEGALRVFLDGTGLLDSCQLLLEMPNLRFLTTMGSQHDVGTARRQTLLWPRTAVGLRRGEVRLRWPLDQARSSRPYLRSLL